MEEKTLVFKGTSMGLNFLSNGNIDIKNAFRILKKFEFNNERKFGFQDIKEYEKYIEFKYFELIAKNLEVFEDNKITLKTIYQPKYSFIFIFEDITILTGSSNLANKIRNKLKNTINLDLRPILKNKNQMMKLYNFFFKVYQIKLIEEDESTFIKSLRIKGDLSDLENWKEFSSNNRFLSEIYGQLEIDEIIHNLRIYSNSSCQIYKTGDSILKKDIFWLKDFLLKL